MRVQVRSKGLFLLVLMALLIAPWRPILATGKRPPGKPSASPLRLAALLASSVDSDFDGDHKLDRAELHSAGLDKSISISLSSSRRTSLTFTSGSYDRGSLLAVDIDHDSDLDLVWVSPTRSQPPVVWINDGRGNFERESGAQTAELDSLFGSGADASVANNSTVNHRLGAPTQSFPSDLALAGEPSIGDPARPRATPGERHHYQATYLTYLRKRGPPFTLL
jgi:hypothetical protein